MAALYRSNSHMHSERTYTSSFTHIHGEGMKRPAAHLQIDVNSSDTHTRTNTQAHTQTQIHTVPCINLHVPLCLASGSQEKVYHVQYYLCSDMLLESLFPGLVISASLKGFQFRPLQFILCLRPGRCAPSGKRNESSVYTCLD